MKTLRVFKSTDRIPFLVSIIDDVEEKGNELVFRYEDVTCVVQDWDYYHVDVFEIEDFLS